MRKTEDYIIYAWKKSQFLEKAEIILSLAFKVGIHKIERSNGECLYLVPEEFYQRAVKALKNTATSANENKGEELCKKQ